MKTLPTEKVNKPWKCKSLIFHIQRIVDSRLKYVKYKNAFSLPNNCNKYFNSDLQIITNYFNPRR